MESSSHPGETERLREHVDNFVVVKAEEEMFGMFAKYTRNPIH